MKKHINVKEILSQDKTPEEIILELHQKLPRYYVRAIKEYVPIWNLIKDLPGSNDLEKIYYFLNPTSKLICEISNKNKKFKNFEYGFTYCDITSKCECRKNSVSQKVSDNMQAYSKDKKDEIQEKRENTNNDRYGVINTGQTQMAISAHTAFYADEENIKLVSAKVAATKFDRHGNEKYNNSEKAQQTVFDLYKINNFGKLSKYQSNPNLELLKNKDSLNKLINEYSLEDISRDVGCHISTVCRYLRGHNLTDSSKSYGEKALYIFLTKDLNIPESEIILNSRSILNNKQELDLYLPNYNLAIEFNGIFWHSSECKDKDYHFIKYKNCHELNINLFSIWSNLWYTKPEIIKSMISYKLNKINKTLYARNCDIREIIKAPRDFLNTNHIQGFAKSEIKLGLYHEGELMSLMTFGSPRPSISSKNEQSVHSFEIVRFCNKLNLNVIGAASKLLSYFIERYNPRRIFSFSDNAYGSGKLYEELKFIEEQSTQSPGYFYIEPKGKNIQHRSRYQKHKLKEMNYLNIEDGENKTEEQIMLEAGFFRIYDCGMKKWIRDF